MLVNDKKTFCFWTRLTFIALVFLVVCSPFYGAAAASNLNGRILLQVQDKGQAWYVNPLNGQRYYLGRPEDAYSVMRTLGLGVSNADFASYSQRVPARLAGRILLKVQDKGQAYYVDPLQLKLYYLGRPADAFSVMRSRGLGITNADLAKIAIAPLKAAAPTSSSSSQASNADSRNYQFQYQSNHYELILSLSSALYDSYKSTPKLVTYEVGHEPENLREVFYGLFLQAKSGDTSINDIVSKLKKLADDKGWSDDQAAEFVLSFVQYMPYDQAKVSAGNGSNSNPYFPYETLYLNKGVCSDKTFLALMLLRKLGYGAAILDFPEHNHTALGISCPTEYSVNNSGYCYVETTNYFPLGVIPQSLSNGQAQTEEEFANSFNAGSLGRMEIYQATLGKVYQGMPALHARIDALRAAKNNLNTLQTEITALSATLTTKENAVNILKQKLDSYYNNGQTREYNSLVPEYNNLVNDYNSSLSTYSLKISEYNAKVIEYNASVKLFYQQ